VFGEVCTFIIRARVYENSISSADIKVVVGALDRVLGLFRSFSPRPREIGLVKFKKSIVNRLCLW